MQATPLTLALIICLAAPATAHDQHTITATLDLSQTGAENPAADALFEQLDASDGQVITLDLTLSPIKNASDPGYQLMPLQSNPEPVICGNGTFGTIENLQTLFTLDFQHPSHFHAPTMIHIGDRLRFPHHDITCGYGDSGAENTSLRLVGDFIVETAGIPTAISYTLFPVNP